MAENGEHATDHEHVPRSANKRRQNILGRTGRMILPDTGSIGGRSHTGGEPADMRTKNRPQTDLQQQEIGATLQHNHTASQDQQRADDK